MSKLTLALVSLAAASVSARAGWAWWGHRHQLVPDLELYTQGGLGFFPSPLGRAVGWAGADVLAMLSALGSGAACFVCGWRSRSAIAAWYFALVPLSLWLSFASIDGLALGLFALALVWPSLYWPAALLHLQLVPFAVGAWLVRSGVRSIAAVAVLLAFSAWIVAMTPFSPVVYRLVDVRGMVVYGLWGSSGAVVAVLTVAFLSRHRLLVLSAAAVSVWECGLQHHANPRYFLPALVVGCATMRTTRELLTLRLHQGRSGWRIGFRPAAGRSLAGCAPAVQPDQTLTPPPGLVVSGARPEQAGRRRRGASPAAPTTTQEVMAP